MLLLAFFQLIKMSATTKHTNHFHGTQRKSFPCFESKFLLKSDNVVDCNAFAGVSGEETSVTGAQQQLQINLTAELVSEGL